MAALELAMATCFSTESNELNTNLFPLHNQHVLYIRDTIHQPMRASILNHVRVLQGAGFCDDLFFR